LYAFSTVQSPQVKEWLQAQGIDAQKVTPTRGGHVVVCDSVADMSTLQALDRSQVQVGAGVDFIREVLAENRMSAAEILDLVAERLADEEIINDQKRIVNQAKQAAPPPQRQYRRSVQAVETVDDEEDEND